ncbi:MAG: DNA internalization-related competence protein ComEC/Rec2 [Clostridia bacterium]|nr:DNA internalization-related competence protein ComEC/Rec2 [Clostridia bacterium]
MINEFFKRISYRPLLLPVIFLIISGMGEYYLFIKWGTRLSIIYSSVLIVLLLFFCIYTLVKRLDSKITFAAILTLSLVIYSTCIYQNRFFLGESSGIKLSDDIVYDFTITDIEYKLDGKIRYYAFSDKFGKVIIYNTDELVDLGIKTLCKISLKGKLLVPSEGTNPGEFNNKEYLNKQGIFYIFKPQSVVSIKDNNNPLYNSSSTINYLNFNLRSKIYSFLNKCLEPENSELSGAIFLGDKSELSDDVKRDFRLSNSSHILACSGTHFTAFLLFVPVFLDKYCKRKKTKVVIYSIIATIIGILTGFGKSVTRAYFMSITRFSGRESISGILFAFIIIVLVNPFVLFDGGFQMSFMVSTFIVLFADRNIENNGIASFIKLTFLALISILPFMLTTDYYLNPVNILVQLINNTILLVACILIIPCALLSVISVAFIWPIDMLLTLMRKIVVFSSSFSLITINLRMIYYPLLVSLFLGFIVYKLPKVYIKKFLIKFTILIISSSLGAALAEYITAPTCKVIFADVGQGDSALIISEKYNAIIDGGVYEEGEKTLFDLLDYYQIDRIDFAIITHPDGDHGGGIAALYNLGRVKSIYSSYIKEDKIMALGFEIMPDIVQLVEGYSIKLSNSTVLKVISPSYITDGENDDSLVISLNCFNTSILFTGDISSSRENKLIESSLIDKADVLKVSHHGSRFSTSSEFIATVNPKEAVISVGKYNNYGHPSEEVIERLNESEVDIYTTCDCGAVIVDIYYHKYELYGYLEENNV